MSAPAPWTMVPAVLAFLLVPTGLAAQATGSPKQPLVEVNTTAGRMVVALFNETPQHRDNFMKLVREHYYDSTLFHRVVSEFIIQGGDPQSRDADDRHMVLGRGGSGATLPPEIKPGLLHTKGALAASFGEDGANPEKRSHGSQFYFVDGQSWTASELRLLQQNKGIEPADARAYTAEQLRAYVTKGGAPRLDGDFTVFGEVVEGLDVLDRIAALPCDKQGRPLTDVRIWMRELP